MIVKDFLTDAKGHKERLAQGHRVKGMLQQLQTTSEKLVQWRRLILSCTGLKIVSASSCSYTIARVGCSTC